MKLPIASLEPGHFEFQTQQFIPELVYRIKNLVWYYISEDTKETDHLIEEFKNQLDTFTELRTGLEPNIEQIKIAQITGILEDLKLDVEATRKDPATDMEKHQGAPRGADTYSIIASHTSFNTFALYRIAHLLWRSGYIHHALQLQNYLKRTGPEIHPGAQIASGAVIDHGSGTVIGETVIIGETFYGHHGDTLGGIGKWIDIEGDIQWSQYRHPWIGPNVLLGANVQILSSVVVGHPTGPVTIGVGSSIDRCILEEGASVDEGITLKKVIVPAHHRVIRNCDHNGEYLVRLPGGRQESRILPELDFEVLKQRRYLMQEGEMPTEVKK